MEGLRPTKLRGAGTPALKCRLLWILVGTPSSKMLGAGPVQQQCLPACSCQKCAGGVRRAARFCLTPGVHSPRVCCSTAREDWCAGCAGHVLGNFVPFGILLWHKWRVGFLFEGEF